MYLYGEGEVKRPNKINEQSESSFIVRNWIYLFGGK